MRLALALAASIAATAAFAQTTTIIERDRPSTTVIERERPATTVIERRSTDTTGAVGCDTTTQRRTDGATGDTTVRKTTEC